VSSIIQIGIENKKIKGEINLPTSKSINNRLLIMQALSDEKIDIAGLSEADDTQLLLRLLSLIQTRNNSEEPVTIDCYSAGTTFRFLTAFLSIQKGRWLLTGDDRMKQRPIGELVNALATAGADIKYNGNEDFPPLLISGKLIHGGTLEIQSDISSQYISALLLIAPYMTEGLNLSLQGSIVSEPYIRMTLELMKQCGIQYLYEKNTFRINPQKYRTAKFLVEPDWSAASYWYEVAALSEDAEIILPGLNHSILQGDAIVSSLFAELGVETIFQDNAVILKKNSYVTNLFEFDFSACPDLAQTVAVTCAALKIRAHLKGLQNLNIKETERLKMLALELKKIGVNAEILNDSELIIYPSEIDISDDHIFQTYSDHRMAMAFAPLSILNKKINITEPEVVKKSYPTFWTDLQSAGFTISF
jgi:3-phosphoshikimate 1-carboxyvinyltransferase